VFFKDLSGKTNAMWVLPQGTVLSAQMKIYERTGVHPLLQRLIFGGKQLDPSRTLATYRIRAGSTVHLVSRLRAK